MIVDKLGREFRKLRVSLTASCNYACTYCVPDGEKRLPAKYELSQQDFIQLLILIKKLTNIDQLRITGGEPLVSPLFDSFLGRINECEFDDVSITTNGQLLEKKIKNIKQAGIKRINVSLDTLDPSRFRSISKGGDLFSVLAGIESAIAENIAVKINMVPLRRYNSDQIMPLLEYCMDKGIELRFIELMRMGHLNNDALFKLDYVSMQQILAEIARQYHYVRADAPFDSTSTRFHIPARDRYFGIIANESEPFCSSCTRLRLSSSGHLHGCLSSNERHFVGDIARLPEDLALSALREKLVAAMGNKQSVFSGGETVMRIVGG